jgi:hypothetical protein
MPGPWVERRDGRLPVGLPDRAHRTTYGTAGTDATSA